MNDFGDKNLKAAIESRLSIFKMLDTDTYNRVKDTIESFKKKEDLIHFMINPVNMYGKPNQEPSGLTMNDVIAKERIIITEPVTMGFKAKTVIDGEEVPLVTTKNNTILPSYIRKNQQISNKEARSATTDNTTDILGQAAGTDKVGTFSDAEWTVCLQHNMYNVVKELNGPASHDLEQKKVFRSSIINTGEVSLKDLPDNIMNKRTVMYIDQMLKMMDIDSDLIQMPE